MSTSPDPRSKRPEFLLEMYKQMMADINRHIMVVWQSIGVLLGSFAIIGMVEKKVLSLDFAASLFVMICTWSLDSLLILAIGTTVICASSRILNVCFYFQMT